MLEHLGAAEWHWCQGAPEHLIRRSGQLVPDRPSRSVCWADIPESSTQGRGCPLSWQQYWRQSRRGPVPEPVPARTLLGMFRARSGQAPPGRSGTAELGSSSPDVLTGLRRVAWFGLGMRSMLPVGSETESLRHAGKRRVDRSILSPTTHRRSLMMLAIFCISMFCSLDRGIVPWPLKVLRDHWCPIGTARRLHGGLSPDSAEAS